MIHYALVLWGFSPCSYTKKQKRRQRNKIITLLPGIYSKNCLFRGRFIGARPPIILALPPSLSPHPPPFSSNRAARVVQFLVDINEDNVPIYTSPAFFVSRMPWYKTVHQSSPLSNARRSCRSSRSTSMVSWTVGAPRWLAQGCVSSTHRAAMQARPGWPLVACAEGSACRCVWR